MEFIDDNTIRLDKEINELDRFTLDFIRIIEKHVKYVVISGFVAILFGRSRGTEDIDMFIHKLDRNKFNFLYEDLATHGYECITASEDDAYDNLTDNIPIRFSRRNNFIPNIEVKFAKMPLDIQSLNENLKVITSYGEVRVSHIEQQIAFKEVCLKSDKDIEDALHLRYVFKEKLDERKIKHFKMVFEDVL